MTQTSGLLRSAIRRLRKSVLLPLLGGNALLMLAAMSGLLLPDSHIWQVLLSLLLAVGLLCGVLLWNASAMRHLRSATPSIPLWQGALLLGFFVMLAAVACFAAGLPLATVELRAGYWNSQMPAALRHALPYQRLIALQQFASIATRSVLVPAILLPFAMESAAFGLGKAALHRGLRCVASLQHWVVAILALGTIRTIVPTIAAWHPAHSVSGETVSALLRLGLAGVLTITCGVLLLCVDAELLSRIEDRSGPTLKQHRGA